MNIEYGSRVEFQVHLAGFVLLHMPYRIYSFPMRVISFTTSSRRLNICQIHLVFYRAGEMFRPELRANISRK